MWTIASLPTEDEGRRSRDYVGWLRHGDIHVRIAISHQGLTAEHARLIVQHFAGIITEEGLMQVLPEAAVNGGHRARPSDPP